MSEQWQEDEASLQSYDREQADLERQTDALVLKTLTSLVSAAEDLKTRLRRDTDSLLEEYRRTKRGLENDISMASADRQRLRDEAESERDQILSEARAEAERVVREAQAERESLLGEVRESQQRLRTLEAQILQVLGAARGGAATTEPAGSDVASTSAPVAQPRPDTTGDAPGVTSPSSGLGVAALGAAALGAAALGAAAVGAVRGSTAATPPPPSVDVEDDAAATDFEVDTATSDLDVDTTSLGEPEPADHLDATTATLGAPVTEPARPAEPSTLAPPPFTTEAARDDEQELSFAPSPSASAPTRTDEAVEMPAAPPPTGAPTTAPSSAVTPSPAAPGAGITEDTDDTAASTAPRGLQLVFDGVPGYQQAAAIERAVGDLVDDSDVEIIEFEQGQLVLQVEAANPRALADRLMAKPPLPMRLVASGHDSATFQLTAG